MTSISLALMAVVVSVADFGAKSDGTKCTEAFAQAVGKCAEAGGGRVIVPPGTWYTGAIHLRSNVELHLEEGAEILFSDDRGDYLPPVMSSWEGLECMNLSPLLYAYCCTNVAVTGSGTIRAKMDFWSRQMDEGKTGIQAARAILYKWGSEDYPVESRDIVAAHPAVLRPQLIQFNRCRDVRLEGVRIRESPFWTIHLFMCDGVAIRGIDVCAHGFNNDGVDIEMTRNVLIEDSVFDQGDDGFVFKSGRNRDAWRTATPTENVEVRNCRVKQASSLVGVGSELSGGVRDVYVHDCSVDNAVRLYFVKTNHRRGGFVKNVRLENVHTKLVCQVMSLSTSTLYQWAEFPDYETRITEIDGLVVSNVSCEACSESAISLHGDRRLPARNVRIADVRVGRSGKKLIDIDNVAGVEIVNVTGGDVGDVPYEFQGGRPKDEFASAPAAPVFTARLASVAIEGGTGGGCAADARAELERHLSLVAGYGFSPAAGAADLTIVLGERAPGAGEPEPFTAYAKLAGDRLYLWGDDARCPGTLFAVYGFLEKVLGVVWPVPGDANIVAPPAASVKMPADWSWRYCPPLRCGMIRGGKPLTGAPKDGNAHLAPNALRRTAEQIVQANDDFRRWKLRQKMFVREDMPFGHAFTGWNDKYFDTHPEYLALQANGVRGLAKKGSRDAQYMKLCLANEDVVDLIVTNYVKAGCPKYYNICPNDGYRFCRCEKCRALDCPVTEDEREMNISKAVNLTDRYVNFWNRIAAKVVAIRPDVMLNTYAYSCYRDPPRRERVAFPDNMCFGMVPSQEDDNLAQIRAWKERGLKHFKLRPNYLCYKGWIPRGYERFFLENFRMNFREGMIGTDYDASSLRSGVTAFEYYAIARAHQDPEVAFEQVEREFLSQYGAAAPKMKEYYGRVRERGERALYAKQRVRAGDKEAVLDDSLLVGTVLGANPPEELEKDEEVLRAALATPGLSAAEYRRVRAVSVLPRHALLARDFQLAFDSEKTGEMAPDFVEKGLRLMDYRIKEVQPAVGPVNWGPSFRGYPFEVKYWRQRPIKRVLEKLYPEMGYAG